MLKKIFNQLLHLSEEYLALLSEENCRLCRQEIIKPVLKDDSFKGNTSLAFVNLNLDNAYFKNYFKASQTICNYCLAKAYPDKVFLTTYDLIDDHVLTVLSATQYKGHAKWLIYQLKYLKDSLIAIDLAVFLLKAWLGLKPIISNEIRLDNYLIVPVPLHPKRLKERGYNQASKLGQNLSRLTNIPFNSKAIIKIKPTKSQQGLSREDRLINLNGAFIGKKEIVKDKTILLIDDVITTGSTLKACSQALYKAGAKSVYGLTPAISIRYKQFDTTAKLTQP